MRNIVVIFRKEMKSYFASPIAYLLLAIFAIIFGFFFYSATRFFVLQGMQMQMMGRGMPMDVNEYVIRPLLTNASVIGLFLIPMITMRLYAEEKRSGTIELLMTSPVRDLEIVLGKWLAALVLYAAILGISAINMGLLFAFGRPDWKPAIKRSHCLLLQADTHQAGAYAGPGESSQNTGVRARGKRDHSF